MDKNTINNINQFWVFFEEISKRLLIDPENFELIEMLEGKVNQLLGLGWEYGPSNNGLYFCLSPNNDYNLIDYTRFAISLAPDLLDWKFVVGKPQKVEEIDEFILYNDDGTETRVITTAWRAVVYKFKDGTYDIDILIDESLDVESKDIALDIALTNMLGEIHCMEKINKVAVVEQFDDDTDKRGFEFRYLPAVLNVASWG